MPPGRVDRWLLDASGGEVGKQLAHQVTPVVGGDEDALSTQDSSIQALIRYYREHRASADENGKVLTG